MEDVTDLLNRYREGARLVWNNFLRDEDAYYDLSNELTCDFNAIKRLLFTALVLRPFEQDDFLPGFVGQDHLFFSWVEPIPFLRVVPQAAGSPAMINRDAGAHHGYWDAPVTRIGSDADLRLIDYFDWDQAGYRDFHYYHVQIVSFPAHPELVRHDALIETLHARVFFDPPASPTT